MTATRSPSCSSPVPRRQEPRAPKGRRKRIKLATRSCATNAQTTGTASKHHTGRRAGRCAAPGANTMRAVAAARCASASGERRRSRDCALSPTLPCSLPALSAHRPRRRPAHRAARERRVGVASQGVPAGAGAEARGAVAEGGRGVVGAVRRAAGTVRCEVGYGRLVRMRSTKFSIDESTLKTPSCEEIAQAAHT